MDRIRFPDWPKLLAAIRENAEDDWPRMAALRACEPEDLAPMLDDGWAWVCETEYDEHEQPRAVLAAEVFALLTGNDEGDAEYSTRRYPTKTAARADLFAALTRYAHSAGRRPRHDDRPRVTTRAH